MLKLLMKKLHPVNIVVYCTEFLLALKIFLQQKIIKQHGDLYRLKIK